MRPWGKVCRASVVRGRRGENYRMGFYYVVWVTGVAEWTEGQLAPKYTTLWTKRLRCCQRLYCVQRRLLYRCCTQHTLRHGKIYYPWCEVYAVVYDQRRFFWQWIDGQTLFPYDSVIEDVQMSADAVQLRLAKVVRGHLRLRSYPFLRSSARLWWLSRCRRLSTPWQARCMSTRVMLRPETTHAIGRLVGPNRDTRSVHKIACGSAADSWRRSPHLERDICIPCKFTDVQCSLCTYAKGGFTVRSVRGVAEGGSTFSWSHRGRLTTRHSRCSPITMPSHILAIGAAKYCVNLLVGVQFCIGMY